MDNWPVIVTTLLFSAFFSGMEIAYVSSNKLEIELRKKKGHIPAQILSGLLKYPSRFIGTMLIGNNVALVVYGIAMAAVLEPAISRYTDSEITVLIVQTVISTFIVLLTAEFLPKALFRINPNAVLNAFAGPLWVVYYILYVPVIIIIGLSELLMKQLLRIDFSTVDPIFGKTDLDHYLREATAGQENNEHIEPEIQIFQNALDFSSIKVRECMIPRTEIVAMDIEDPVDAMREKFVETGLSKILIYKGNIDTVIGYTHSYELFKKPKKIRSILLPIIIAPETMPASELMTRFIEEHKSIAVVVDEFGGTAGMVTMEDIIEEIFGEIEDEHDTEELTEKKVGEQEWLLSGRHEIDYLNDQYNLELPESEEYETLSGMLTHHYESIPAENEEIIIGKARFIINKATDTRIELIRLKLGKDD